MTTLESVAREWIKEQRRDGYTSAARDLLEHGCASGMMADLIYYHDTVKFYRKHKAEINELLAELGGSPAEIFRDWDDSDPLATDTHNQNLLAWFGFEEAVRRVVEW